MRSRLDSATPLRSFMQSMSLRKASVGIAARVDIIHGSVLGGDWQRREGFQR